MILKTLSLKNYRKFKDTSIEFPEGVIGVVGLNGVGKSTLFEAIAWALYGPVAARTGTEHIKREGATPSDPCRVELEFQFDDDTYRVVREMTVKQLSASGIVTVNGKIAATGAEIVSKFIQKKLGMDWKSFYTSIFAKQKELNTLSSMNPSERRQLILRMLGINAVDDIISEIRSDTKEKKTVMDRLGTILMDEHGQEKRTFYEQQKQVVEKKYRELQKNHQEQKKQLLKMNEELEKRKKENEIKKQSYEKLCATKEEWDEKKSNYEKKQQIENEIQTHEKLRQERTASLEKQKTKLLAFKTIDSDLRTLEKQQEKNASLLEKVAKQQEQNETLQQRLHTDEQELRTKKHHIEKMGPQARCPTCERVLGQQHNTLLKIYTDELKKKHQESKKLTEEAAVILKEYDRLAREKQALQKKNVYLRNQIVEREKLSTSIRHVSEELNNEQRFLEAKKKELKTLGTIRYDEKQYSTIRQKVNDTYQLYQQSLKQLNDSNEQQQKLLLHEKEGEGDINLLNQKIQTFEQQIKEQHALAEKLKKEQQEVQQLSLLSEVMDSYRSYLISQIRPTLSAYASELFDQLTDGKYSHIELDEDYTLLIYDQGTPYNIERFSGGEEDLANLCIRLAISEIITERAGSVFHFIILDEIFGSQDQIRKQNIIKALNGFSTQFQQIFLITHIDEIKHFTEHLVTVTEDENGISTVTLE